MNRMVGSTVHRRRLAVPVPRPILARSASITVSFADQDESSTPW